MPRSYRRKKDGQLSTYDKPTGKKPGRPSKCNEDIQNHALTLSSIGLLNTQIAEEMDIKWTTFSNWLRKFPEFKSSLDENRNKMLTESKKCLMKRIEGYSYKETKIEVVKDSKDRIIKKKSVVIKKELAPDTHAAMYVLDRRSQFFRRRPVSLDETSEDDHLTIVVEKAKK